MLLIVFISVLISIFVSIIIVSIVMIVIYAIKIDKINEDIMNIEREYYESDKDSK